ncbi:PREDICTED: PRUPE_6G082500 [Prunus dulcis]|uniref:PREDICTED: PRUPE_6G082500 n=1 Tax=Prunus dulcis TaxID=3755 RepID=A0A5E4EZ34_PRUDU|nr:PREDICTED: PRUPE_6G082500 [Prunus dulcis]
MDHMRGLKCPGLGKQGFSAIQGVQQCHVLPQGILESICLSFQVNIDGAWHPRSSIGGNENVVCDSGGDVVVGCAMLVHNVFSVALVEALAARIGVSLVVDRGFMNVSFESDALQIVSAF